MRAFSAIDTTQYGETDGPPIGVFARGAFRFPTTVAPVAGARG
jgi:hypothetical protein